MKITLKILGFAFILGALALVIALTTSGYKMDMIRFMLLVNLSLIFLIFKLFFRRRRATIVISVIEIGTVSYFLKSFYDNQPELLEDAAVLMHQVFMVMIGLSILASLFLVIVTLVRRDKVKSKLFSHGLY